MKKFRAYAIVIGSKFLGEVEAEDKAAAEDKAYELDTCSVSICHQCAREIDDAQIDRVEVEEIED